jgi:membrane protease YdiL (CAAX protease family)
MTALPEDARAAGDWREAGYLAAAATAIAAIVAVEAALVVPGHLLAAQIADAVLVFLLVNAGPRSAAQPPTARAATGLAVLRALALVPLIRVVALGLPMRDWSEPAAVIAIALPVGLVALRLAPLVGLRLGRLFGAPSPVDLYALAAGGGLGLVACLSGAPSLWPDGAGSGRIAVAIGAAMVAACAEELVFRGLVQGTLQRAFGRIGMLAAAGLFSATYLDAGSAALVLSFALAGVVFSHVVSISGSLPGVMLAHVLLVLGAGAIWPSLLDHPAADLDTQGTVIALAIAIAVAAALACLHPLKQAPAQRGGDER